MGFFGWLKSKNPFKSNVATKSASSRLGDFAANARDKFKEAVENASPSAALRKDLPQWNEQQLAGLSADGLEVPRDAMDAFLYFGTWLPVQSSNVEQIHYDPSDSTLKIKFLNGGYYQYDDVSIREAESFANASSKGKWVWDELRKRGTVFGFNRRHPYTFLSGPTGVGLGGYTPQWYRSSGTRSLHGKIPDSGAPNESVMKRLMPKTFKRMGKKKVK